MSTKATNVDKTLYQHEQYGEAKGNIHQVDTVRGVALAEKFYTSEDPTILTLYAEDEIKCLVDTVLEFNKRLRQHSGPK